MKLVSLTNNPSDITFRRKSPSTWIPFFPRSCHFHRDRRGGEEIAWKIRREDSGPLKSVSSDGRNEFSMAAGRLHPRLEIIAAAISGCCSPVAVPFHAMNTWKLGTMYHGNYKWCKLRVESFVRTRGYPHNLT